MGMTQKRDIRFYNLIIKYDEIAKAMHIYDSQDLYWLTIYRIYSVFRSLYEVYHLFTNLKVLR